MVLLDVYGADGSLFVNGQPLSIKGVNWFGSESYGGPPGGLAVHTIDFYLDFLQEHKFNALRLLFNHQSVMRDAVVEAPPNLLDDLREVRYIEQFSLLARAAARRGILIVLGCHRIAPDAWPGKGLWYDPAYGFSEARVMQSWSTLARGSLVRRQQGSQGGQSKAGKGGEGGG